MVGPDDLSPSLGGQGGGIYEQHRLVLEEYESLSARYRDLEDELAREKGRKTNAVSYCRAIYTELGRALEYTGKLRSEYIARARELAAKAAWPNGQACPHCGRMEPSLDDLHRHVMLVHRSTAENP